nr:fibrobacter succinogenes major paralogous domain-containing protein [Bacteroidota bacterium]
MNTKNTLAFITVGILLICSCEREWDNPNDRKSDSYFYVGTCGVLTDSRDGKQYNTVQIGDQCWMKENLAYLPSVSNPEDGSETTQYYYVYGYEGTNVSEAKATSKYKTYGVLYNCPAALNACPGGWHLPSDDEWTVLTDYLGGENLVGGNMKEAGTAHWASPNTGATNSSGFSGLPGGIRSSSGNFYTLGSFGSWWSSTESSSASAWVRLLYYDLEIVIRSDVSKEYGFSVRCLRDF